MDEIGAQQRIGEEMNLFRKQYARTGFGRMPQLPGYSVSAGG